MRRDDLYSAADREQVLAERRDALTKRIEDGSERLAGVQAQREAIEALPRRERGEALSRVDSLESRSRSQLRRLEDQLAEMPVPGDTARREFAIADRVLAERRQLAICAAHIAPPAYITNELGRRPSDPAKRAAWDRGVSEVERYRQQHGVVDRNHALGVEPKQRAELARREAELRRLRQVQRQLGRDLGKVRMRERRRGLGIAR